MPEAGEFIDQGFRTGECIPFVGVPYGYLHFSLGVRLMWLGKEIHPLAGIGDDL